MTSEKFEGALVPFSHVLITRPRQESQQLAKLAATLGLSSIAMPAFEFHSTALSREAMSELDQIPGNQRPLMIFTSPRSVEYGLPQVPAKLMAHAKVASIGASTARCLSEAGISVAVRPSKGYGSEELLEAIKGSMEPSGSIKKAYVLTAPGGRAFLQEGLESLGYETKLLMVYGKKPAEITEADMNEIGVASKMVVIWTSANAMDALSKRLPSSAWLRICQSEWLVVSERLKRLARAYGPKCIHIAPGPSNIDLAAALQSIVKN